MLRKDVITKMAKERTRKSGACAKKTMIGTMTAAYVSQSDKTSDEVCGLYKSSRVYRDMTVCHCISTSHGPVAELLTAKVSLYTCVAESWQWIRRDVGMRLLASQNRLSLYANDGIAQFKATNVTLHVL